MTEQQSRTGPRAIYLEAIESGKLDHDEAQARAVDHLERIHRELAERRAHVPTLGERLKSMFRPATLEPVRGLYMWGGVGRGKTWLMDHFYHCLPGAGRQRLHFHRFMRMVHQELRGLRDQANPLTIIADRFASDTRVLCFDEFFVADIGDAMILGGLLEALFERGVTLVTTSNTEPDELYRDGLQRDRFLPAIGLLKRHTTILNVDGGTDYRLRQLDQADIYFTPADDEAVTTMTGFFERLAMGDVVENATLMVNGRDISTRLLSDGVVWFGFENICDGPRSTQDYIEVARLFHTVLISSVPVFDRSTDDQARRFIELVDEFYDRNVNLVLSADAPPPDLYHGRRLSDTFKRTASRLLEMQSTEYLAREHRP